MLEDCLFASRASARSKKPATLVFSVLIHGTLAGALILIPLFQNQVLPQIPLFQPLQPPVAPRGVELVPVPRGRSASPASSQTIQPTALVAPEMIPTTIVRVVEPSTGPVGFLPASGKSGTGGPDGIPGGDPLGDPNGLSVGRPLAPPPPPQVAAPPPPPPEPPPSTPVRRSSTIVQSSLIKMVKPVYPRLAVLARVEGAVVLEAVITREGTIDASRLRVLTGHSLLRPAAVEAVQQWLYRPTVLSGQPVEVLTTITVNFTLN